MKSADVEVVAVGTDRLLWRKQADAVLAPILRAAVSSVVVQQRAADMGLSEQRLRALLQPAVPTDLTAVAGGSDSSSREVVAVVGLILLFIAINFYGGFVLLGVIEEKSTRVVEVLLARLRPQELLTGKVIGIGLLGIMQMVAIAVTAVVTVAVVRPADLPSSTYASIGQVVFWFVLGFAFYSVLYAALGSLTSRTEDAQSATAPLTMLLLVAYVASFSALQNPEAWWVTVLSFLPPTAPLLMPVRVAMLDVPWWQVGFAALFTAAGVAGLLRLGGRLYRGAILHTGSTLKLAEAWRTSKAM